MDACAGEKKQSKRKSDCKHEKERKLYGKKVEVHVGYNQIFGESIEYYVLLGWAVT